MVTRRVKSVTLVISARSHDQCQRLSTKWCPDLSLKCNRDLEVHPCKMYMHSDFYARSALWAKYGIALSCIFPLTWLWPWYQCQSNENLTKTSTDVWCKYKVHCRTNCSFREVGNCAKRGFDLHLTLPCPWPWGHDHETWCRTSAVVRCICMPNFRLKYPVVFEE